MTMNKKKYFMFFKKKNFIKKKYIKNMIGLENIKIDLLSLFIKLNFFNYFYCFNSFM